MSRRRVVVTGMGMVSPLGNTVDETWSSILAGTSGVVPIETFDVSAFPTRFAATVKNFDPSPYMPAKEARKMDVFLQYGLVAAIQAVQDSGLEITEEDASRVGTCIGSGMGGIQAIEHNAMLIAEKGPRRVSPFFVPGAIINMVAGNLSIKYGMKGPNLSTTTACTTGTHAIGLGMRTIQYGDADVMVCGGAEMVTTPVGLGGFCAARALSTRNDDPQAASRPWDVDRDGFVLGEGAGVLVLEEYERAKARGATIYAELAGFGMSGDAHHMTSPPEDGAGAALSMQNALRDAGLDVEGVQYINAHGTSTLAGDKAEIKAVQAVFGEAADKLAVSSTKSMTGHLLGAAGAIEAIFSVLTLRDQVAPPTINLDHPDEACNDVNLVPWETQERVVDAALSNSFGFGGTNGSLIFRRV
ncbi:beta-ketoacyl-ACP synthase II [Microbulbifer thermotolerans]|uniref:3-oxoacyl-[acyl-carrier-protein] synthase 2 n=1 Tax=Microbulbifer thermotolerans TaxID=252514 RepID=A0A143HLW3_MICTH|nr:beta-ketoacyl-ACP synthase II [Microbulbifer thermotolerans]AMX02497.1 beta-ketoacyl-[acyl-carrier-protein] synthase II [Microbulbifer thermotolerans]MCX2779351.1 beta-ketoacyl-ACP synthase II [Microbulbifer thermotolerans]MCX2782445.1 beta-ketoacyl-ACP synthase II [Microbulbifer thermotolerans]MCX2795030.1 beta-ketoacyl-ACP synthase II [Microbulbifer thermotolerans]MCX2800598.1 beta-ketoacyl-ACP synthase II [Microbulbifer thermotolerans]